MEHPPAQDSDQLEPIALTEMLLMVLILGLLTLLLVPGYTGKKERSGLRTCYANQKTVVGAMEMYNLDKGTRRTRLDRGFFQDLRSGGYLQSIPEHPHGPGTWRYYRESDSGNGITCALCGQIQ